MTDRNILADITNEKDALSIPHQNLNVTWFDEWQPVLDEALKELPEQDNCPHELYRLMIQNPGSARKRTALVTERDVPVAVAGLRQTGRSQWEPVTQWIIPGIVFPAQPKYLLPTLETLGIDIWVGWWRMALSPPPSHLIRYQETTPVYRMRCSNDVEQYWRKNKHFKTIQNKRNRCQEFTLVINAPGSAEWVIKNWDRKWQENPATVSASLADRILAAEYLEVREQHYTLSLLDGDTLIGGATNTVHGNDLVAGVIYREPKYDWHGVGVRLIDLVFSFAVENGFETMDIGGGHDYKQKWAPQEGERWQFNICPEYLYRAKQVANWGRKVRRTVTSWAHSNQTKKV